MELIPNPLIIPVGIIIGFLVAAPVGPVNVLCIQRTIERGFFGGIAAGLGAVLGDGLLALVAALGIGAVAKFITANTASIQLIGGFIMVGFGVALFAAAPEPGAFKGHHEARYSTWDYITDVPKTFVLTVTNPGALLGVTALIGVASTFVPLDRSVDASVLVAAIVGGSFAWWVGLAKLVGHFRDRIDARYFEMINQIAGFLVFAFGMVMLMDLL